MRPVPPHPSVLARIVEIALFVSLGAGQALAATQTTTTLSVGPSNNVTAGAVVILTATVTNPSAVTKGTVKFCNALVTDCGPGAGSMELPPDECRYCGLADSPGCGRRQYSSFISRDNR